MRKVRGEAEVKTRGKKNATLTAKVTIHKATTQHPVPPNIVGNTLPHCLRNFSWAVFGSPSSPRSIGSSLSSTFKATFLGDDTLLVSKSTP